MQMAQKLFSQNGDRYSASRNKVRNIVSRYCPTSVAFLLRRLDSNLPRSRRISHTPVHSSRIHRAAPGRSNIVRARRPYNWTVAAICSRKEIKTPSALRERVYARPSLKGNRHRWKTGSGKTEGEARLHSPSPSSSGTLDLLPGPFITGRQTPLKRFLRGF